MAFTSHPTDPKVGVPSQEADSQASSAIFRDAVADLESHPESLRIRKLIFCLCKKAWENDLEALNRVSLEELLRDLIQLNPNRDRFKKSLYRLVRSLNRTQSYAIPAKFIFQRLEIFYESQTLPKPDGDSSDDRGQTFNILLGRIVSELERQKEKVRIKKLLLASCIDRWESDLQVIEKHTIRDLILALYQLKPEIEDIEKSLAAIANGLNKPEVYRPITQIILDCVSVLYEYRKYKNESKTDGSNEPKMRANLETSEPPALEMQLPLTDAAASEQLTKQSTETLLQSLERTQYDIFDLRLSILQYTNPLRVKILLFSILDPDWFNEQQDWSILKNFTLDTLLRQILESGRDIKVLESQLCEVTNLLPDVAENQQAAENFLRIIQPSL